MDRGSFQGRGRQKEKTSGPDGDPPTRTTKIELVTPTQFSRTTKITQTTTKIGWTSVFSTTNLMKLVSF